MIWLAHIGGIPIEETLGAYGPVLLLVTGAASAWLGARIRHLRMRRRDAHKRRPSSSRGPGDGAAGRT
jgi:uncharacterized membrane protein